ncbi:MAG: PilZ domain-containing protein [Candidatus Sulfotelmatobacter sp.]
MNPTKAERRSRARVVTQLPVRIRSTSGTPEQTAHCRDVSTSGIFLYTNSQMAAGSDLELVLMLPPELTAGEKCWVCCQARVVRVEQGPGQSCGVAAEIRRLDLLPEIAL